MTWTMTLIIAPTFLCRRVEARWGRGTKGGIEKLHDEGATITLTQIVQLISTLLTTFVNSVVESSIVLFLFFFFSFLRLDLRSSARDSRRTGDFYFPRG